MINLSLESDHYLVGGSRLSQCQIPKSPQPPSDLKPPTINSSFVSNINPFIEQPSQNFDYQFKKHQTCLPDSGGEMRFLEETETKRMKKSKFNQMRIQEIALQQPVSKELLEKKFVKTFTDLLMKKAYIYRDYLFDSKQKRLLAEQYLKPDLQEQDQLQNNFIIQLLFLVWDITQFIFNVIILFIIPIYIGFDEAFENSLIAIIIIFLILDNVLSFFQPLLIKGMKYQKYQIINEKNIYQSLINDTCFTILSCLTILNNTQIRDIYFIFFIYFGLKKQFNTTMRIRDYCQFNVDFIIHIIFLCYLSHLCACIWHYIGISEQNSWIYELNLEYNNKSTQYCYSLLWSTQLLFNIGYFNQEKQIDIQLIYSIIIAFISLFIQGYIFLATLQIYDLYWSNNTKNVNFREFSSFMQRRQVSFLMKARLRNYLRSLNEYKQEHKINDVFKELPPNLKEQLLFTLRIQILYKNKILQKFSKKTLEQLTKIMEYKQYNPDEQIEDVSSLYIVDIGKIEISEFNQITKIITTGESFGELQFFLNNQTPQYFKTLEYVSLYKISSIKFYQLVKQNKIDHERYMYIKHQLENSQFSVINIPCSFCKSYYHLIQNCPLIRYIPDLEKIIKIEQFEEQERQKNYLRKNQMGKSINNQVLKKLKINFEAIKLIRIKHNLVYESSSSEQEIEDQSELSNSSDSEEDFTTDQITSDNKIIDKQQDGTIVSILKQQDQIREHTKELIDLDQQSDEVLIIRPNNQKQTISTAQFQHDQQQQQQIQQNYRFSLMPIEPKVRKSISSLEPLVPYILPDNPSSSVKRIKNYPIKTTKSENENLNKQLKISQQQQQQQSSAKKISSYISIDRVKKNLTKIKEEDTDTLNLSNRRLSEDQSSSPYVKFQGQSQNSLKSKTNNVRQSMKKFSSKLSSIPFKTGTLTQFKSNINQLGKSILNIPQQPGLIDLSYYISDNEDIQDFECMYSYTLYYPLGNYSIMIKKYNNFKYTQKSQRKSKYTFRQNVKDILYNITKVLNIQSNLLK